jgi:hypothetical protein
LEEKYNNCYLAISSDDENESDIHESYTTRKRKQLLESDASEGL